MVNSAVRSDESLRDALVTRARTASDGRLALDAALGLIAAGGVALWHPPGWFLLVSVALCFAAFGSWGIADRELHERDRKNGTPLVRILTALRAVAVLIGSMAAFFLLFSLLGIALGRMIS